MHKRLEHWLARVFFLCPGLPIVLGACLWSIGLQADSVDTEGQPLPEGAPAVTGELEPHMKVLSQLGVSTQLSAVADEIVAQAPQVRGRCEDDAAMQARVEQAIRAHFDPGVLVRRTAWYLKDQLADTGALDTASRWLDSAAGLQIQRDETMLADLSEAELQARIALLDQDTYWTPARQNLVDRYMRSTRAPRFIAMTAIERSAALIALGVCNVRAVNDVQTMASVRQRIENERQELDSLAAAMAEQRLPATALALEQVATADLQLAVEFAASKAGMRFYDAVGVAARLAMAESVEQLLAR